MLVDPQHKDEQTKMHLGVLKSSIKNKISDLSSSIDNDLKQMGITGIEQELKIYNTVEELTQETPNMVVAKSTTNGKMYINNVESFLKKNKSYVISSSVYRNSALDKKKYIKNLTPDTQHLFKDYFKRYTGQDLNKKTLLIWRMGGLGDLIFTQPLLSYIKDKYPQSKIWYATAPGNISLLKSFDYKLIDKYISIPFSFEEFSKADYHLSFEGSIERCKEAESVLSYEIFQKVAGLQFNLNDYPVKLFPNKQLVKRYKDIVGKNTVLIQMKSSSPIRTMSSRKWANIVKVLNENGYDVGFIDSQHNSHICNVFNQEYNLNVKNLALYSKDIQHCLALCENAVGAITIDSSISHFSAGLDLPCVTIFGPFLGKVRIIGKYSDWVDPENYETCGKWPCFIHGNDLDKCPQFIERVAPGCIMSINEELVVDKLMKKIEEKRG